MPSGAELKGQLSLDVCSVGFFSEPGVILLRCAFVLPYARLSLRHLSAPRGVSASSCGCTYICV